jgi:hypothetical protein
MFGVWPGAGPSPEARVRPEVQTRSKAVPHRVIMDVIHQCFYLLLALDGVLPEPALLDVALPMPVPRPADAGADHVAARERAGKEHLHPADAAWVVRVTSGQRLEEMRVVRKDDRRGDAVGASRITCPSARRSLATLSGPSRMGTPVSDDRQEDDAVRYARW